MRSLMNIKHTASITLQINTSNHEVFNQLLGLMWYHNGSKIVDGYDPSLIISNSNKTLTITNFTSSDAGMYKAQVDHLLISPFDEVCENTVLSLLRCSPVLKPAVFCINMDDSDCINTTAENQVRKVSIRSMYSAIQGTLTLEAESTVLCSKELHYSSLVWYRNGVYISSTPNLSVLQKNYDNLSLSQRFQQFNIISYEHSGRYEVQLRINLYSYLRSTCQPYLSNFVLNYVHSIFYSFSHTVARGYIDIDYHKGNDSLHLLLTLSCLACISSSCCLGLQFVLDSDKKAITMNEGATLICQASIEFPPFSMLSLIKNGQMLSSTTNGSLQVDTSGNVDTNTYGLYTCQLNASGVVFQKSYILKEQSKFYCIN